MVGHSAGGSATLELKRNFPERKITSLTYNAPVFEQTEPDKLLDEDKKLMRFAISGDPVSMFQTTFKAPDFNLDAVTNVASAYANPSFENVVKAANASNFAPLLGLRKMSGSYSSPSTAKDFIKSGIEGLAIGTAVGVM